MIKIGHSRHLQHRILTHVGEHGDLEVLRLLVGDRNDEARIHGHLWGCRVEGEREWYRPVQAVLKWIDRVPELPEIASAGAVGPRAR